MDLYMFSFISVTILIVMFVGVTIYSYFRPKNWCEKIRGVLLLGMIVIVIFQIFGFGAYNS